MIILYGNQLVFDSVGDGVTLGTEDPTFVIVFKETKEDPPSAPLVNVELLSVGEVLTSGPVDWPLILVLKGIKELACELHGELLWDSKEFDSELAVLVPRSDASEEGKVWEEDPTLLTDRVAVPFGVNSDKDDDSPLVDGEETALEEA